MRYLTAFFTALLFVGTASAADLVCTVPAANVPRAVELCEVLRVQERVPLSRWDNDACATEFLRRGMRDGEAAVTRNEARKFVRDAVSDALAEFDENHESTLVPSVCGDGELITEFGDEECDDGNLENGDGCDIDCQTE